MQTLLKECSLTTVVANIDHSQLRTTNNVMTRIYAMPRVNISGGKTDIAKCECQCRQVGPEKSMSTLYIYISLGIIKI